MACLSSAALSDTPPSDITHTVLSSFSAQPPYTAFQPERLYRDRHSPMHHRPMTHRLREERTTPRPQRLILSSCSSFSPPAATTGLPLYPYHHAHVSCPMAQHQTMDQHAKALCLIPGTPCCAHCFHSGFSSGIVPIFGRQKTPLSHCLQRSTKQSMTVWLSAGESCVTEY